MFNKWRVLTISRNMSDGESETVEKFDTEKDAFSKFYYQCDKVGTNPATKNCEVVVFTPNGDIARMEMIDNSRFIVEEPAE